MIVTCPECATKYNLPDDKISSAGSKVRCSKCKHVFTVTPPPAGPENGDEALDDLLAGAAPEDAGGATEGFDDGGGENGTDDFGGEDFAEDDADSGLGDLGLNLDDKPRKKKKKGSGKGKKLFFMLLVLFLLLGGTGFALVHFKIIGLDTIPFLGGTENATEATADAGQKSPEDDVRLILLENVRQYYVNNEKAGQLFVIEGKAVNNFDTPKEFIKVQASLFNADGVSLASKEVVCGNVLSYFQLQILSRTELEANLANEMGVLNNNTNLDKGSDTPFMIIFFDPPADVAEFGVKVIEAKIPPEV
jgi:predicted Zn finger-like uncharacterized protein